MKYYCIIAMLLFTFLSIGDGKAEILTIPKAKIKIAVFYTGEAEMHFDANSVSTNLEGHIENGINEINTIFSNSGINTFEALFTSITEFKNYSEPKHRGLVDPYVTYSFDGTYQVLDEIANHEKLETYFESNPNTSFLRKSDLETSFINIDQSSDPDVVLIIVEEDGQAMASDERLLRFSGNQWNDPLYAVIGVKELLQNNLAIPLAFFDIFTLRDNSNETNTTLMSFWNDDIDDASAIDNKLSSENTNIFRCNATKLLLGSSDQMVITASLADYPLDTKTIIDAEISAAIVTIDGSSSVFSVDDIENTPSWIVFSNKRFKTDDGWVAPPCVLSGARLADSGAYNEGNVSMDGSDNSIEELILFPNPFTDKITIRFKAKELSEVHLTIYNLDGRLVDNKTFSIDREETDHEILVDGSHFHAGAYIYQLEIGSSIKTGGIIKK
ncbi:T9SS type A sorting domain-containing protein [Fulvivirga sp. 29W222]|uniref:T9SS type A sorting domain-containing protein n=1 Tax=Fulvivirga marina TaxID=2494733 RepID=A0A937KB46_9BACT|nr:T9SS type A sorting domain-containing protein [Fulvivirga marina]MBL6446416.1 T9SS type A sorting domain-containing protein [Fulvivirga marina]